MSDTTEERQNAQDNNDILRNIEVDSPCRWLGKPRVVSINIEAEFNIEFDDNVLVYLPPLSRNFSGIAQIGTSQHIMTRDSLVAKRRNYAHNQMVFKLCVSKRSLVAKVSRTGVTTFTFPVTIKPADTLLRVQMLIAERAAMNPLFLLRRFFRRSFYDSEIQVQWIKPRYNVCLNLPERHYYHLGTVVLAMNEYYFNKHLPKIDEIKNMIAIGSGVAAKFVFGERIVTVKYVLAKSVILENCASDVEIKMLVEFVRIVGRNAVYVK